MPLVTESPSESLGLIARPASLLLLLYVLLGVPIFTRAAVGGSISGAVKDPSGAGDSESERDGDQHGHRRAANRRQQRYGCLFFSGSPCGAL